LWEAFPPFLEAKEAPLPRGASRFFESGWAAPQTDPEGKRPPLPRKGEGGELHRQGLES